MSNKVELLPLAVTDLSLKYARYMGGNKIRHYSVSAFASIIDDGISPAQRVIDFIQSEEPGTEVVVIEDVISKMKSNNRSSSDKSTITPEDVTHRVLTSRDSQVLKDLNKIKSKYLLHQGLRFITPSELFDHLKGRSLGFKLKEYFKYLFYRYVDPENTSSKFVLRTVDPVRYIAYTYEEKDEKKAFESLAKDLRILSKRGLLLGHLSLPSTIYLADTIGSGLLSKAVFCFVIVDHNKLSNQVNVKMLDLPRKPLGLLGVGGEVNEGELGPNVSTMYEIENITVPFYTGNQNSKEVINSYLESRDAVNRSAENARNRMDNLEVEKNSKNIIEEGQPKTNVLGIEIVPKVKQVVVDFNIKKKE